MLRRRDENEESSSGHSDALQTVKAVEYCQEVEQYLHIRVMSARLAQAQEHSLSFLMQNVNFFKKH